MGEEETAVRHDEAIVTGFFLILRTNSRSLP
jgi:hypothetical protein